MKIAGVPKEFKVFFNRFRDVFPTKRLFFYFTAYVYGIIVMPKQKKNVSQIAAAWVEPLCRSSLEKLMCEVRWEFQKVIQRARTQALRHLSHLPKSQRRVEVVLDDTDLDKFGASVFGVGWYKRRKEDLPWKAIQLVVLGVIIQDWFVPLDFRIYAPEKNCQAIPMQFESKLDQAQSMLRKLKLPRELSVEVMFDSWYLNKKVTETAEKRGWKWYSRCRSNRNITWEKVDENEKKVVRVDRYAQGVEWQTLEYKL
jgi:SRSO17 transposase